MADNENHPLVDLMLARMDSTPEEFGSNSNRWFTTLIDIEEYAPPEQAALVKTKIAAIRLDAAHHRAMDELLNGEDRRRGETMRIQSDGTLGVGTQTPLSQLQAVYSTPPTIKIGSETIDEKLIKKIRGAMKI